MAIGEKIAESRRRLGISQQELSTRIPVTRESIAKYETGRDVPEDLRSVFCQGLDDALFTKDMQREATGGTYIPYLDGPIILHEYASLIFRSRKELKEAKDHLAEIDVTKPIEMMSESEVQHVKRTIRELLDAIATADTLVIDLCSRFGFSYNTEVKNWITSLIARQMKQSRWTSSNNEEV